jgi:hypothetical protein
MLFELHAAKHRAREPVAPRAIKREFGQESNQDDAGCNRYRRARAQFQRANGEDSIERHEDGDGEQKTDQKLGSPRMQSGHQTPS